MALNPYRPPRAAPKDAILPERPALGIVVGFVTDVAGTFVLGNVVAIIYALTLMNRGFDENEVVESIASSDLATLYGIIMIGVGFSMSFAGGFVCVRVARSARVHVPMILGLLSAAFGLILTSADMGLLNLVLNAATFVAVMLGAIYARRPFAGA